MERPVLLVVGAGWGAYPLTQDIDLNKYDVRVVSPERTMQYTPLLASAACGLFDFRLAEEPIQCRKRAALRFYQARAEKVDFERRTVTCQPCVQDLADDQKAFEVAYDKLVLSPGSAIQTFDTPGAKEHALFLRTTDDARKLQRRILQMLDAASLPGIDEQRQKDICHIRIVGGGPIGIEATAELYDLWNASLKHVYPHLEGKVKITIHEVAPQVLGNFDQSLADYAMKSLKEKRIEIKTSSHIEKIDQHAVYTKEDGRLPFGLLLWSTGNKPNALLENLDVKTPEEGLPRILTDEYLRVLRPDGKPMEGIFAVGDAADIEGNSLPLLAAVALQKGEYLVRELNQPDSHPWKKFTFKEQATLAYLGDQDGVAKKEKQYHGESAWIAWRSGNLGWTRNWRRRVMITINWALVWWGGRDIARSR